jgi:hypothetical protein
MEYLMAWEEEEFQIALNAGTFTPFLGAGASSLRSLENASFDLAPWNSVGKTLGKIYVDLPNDESRHFLRFFAQQRLRISREHLDIFMPEKLEAGVARQPLGDDLVDLQVALVRAMTRLTAIFGDEFVKQVPSLRQLPDCAITFSLRQQGEQDAWLDLCKAVVIAKLLRDKRGRDGGAFHGADPEWLPPNKRRKFRISRVYENLVVLTRLLVGQKDEDFIKSLHPENFSNPDMSQMGNALIKAATPRGLLRLDMMQWLGDLLEHSLVFWIPRFPTTLELAFELGLAVPSGLPQRPELAQAAQALEARAGKGKVQEYIQDLMDYCKTGMQDGGAGHRRFYVAIAAVLCDQWEHYNLAAHEAEREPIGIDQFRQPPLAKGHSDRAKKTPVVTTKRSRPAAFMPIAATTNYDSGLECIFDEFGLSYHVIFPVQQYEDSGESDTVPPWIVRTVVRGKNIPDVAMPGRATELPSKVQVQGPIIVKLHGAPTQPEGTDDKNRPFKHRIIVSEKEYLYALQASSSELTWFEQEMFSPRDDARADSDAQARSIWFLGYSIADWNVRLRLFSHLRRRAQSDRPLRAVHRDYEPFRQSILRDLRVELCLGDLNIVPDIILKHYSGTGSSGTVRKFLDDLDPSVR